MERALAFALGREVVAVGDDGFEIEEGKVAVDLAGDAAQHVGKGRDLLALAQAFGIDLGIGRIEAGIADQHDGHAVERG